MESCVGFCERKQHVLDLQFFSKQVWVRRVIHDCDSAAGQLVEFHMICSFSLSPS